MQLPIRLASDTAALPRRMLHLPFQSDGDRLAKSSALNQSVSRRTGNRAGGEGRAPVLAMTGVRQMSVGVDDGLASDLLFLRPIVT